MKRLFSAACLIIGLLLLPQVSFAENVKNPLSMEELSIKILPEFTFHPLDQKRVHPPLLIGYQGTLVNKLGHSIKGRIQVPLPVHEKNFRIGYVADYSSDLTKTHNLEYAIDMEKGTISWVTSENIEPRGRYKFTIEYYTDSLKVNKDKRSLAYKFKSFADIELVNIFITSPYKAKKVMLTPSPAQNSHDDSENAFTYTFHNVKAGDEKSFTLTYDRSETKPTMDLMNTKNSVKEEKANKNSNYLVISSIIGGCLLLTGILVIFIKNRKRAF